MSSSEKDGNISNDILGFDIQISIKGSSKKKSLSDEDRTRKNGFLGRKLAKCHESLICLLMFLWKNIMANNEEGNRFTLIIKILAISFASFHHGIPDH